MIILFSILTIFISLALSNPVFLLAGALVLQGAKRYRASLYLAFGGSVLFSLVSAGRGFLSFGILPLLVVAAVIIFMLGERFVSTRLGFTVFLGSLIIFIVNGVLFRVWRSGSFIVSLLFYVGGVLWVQRRGKFFYRKQDLQLRMF
jgi:hypothetical protein